MVAGIYGCSNIFVIKIIAKRKKRVENVELEFIMSDIAYRYLCALIVFMVTVVRAGTFYLSIKFF